MKRALSFLLFGMAVLIAFSLRAMASTATITFTSVLPGDQAYGSDYAGVYLGTVNGTSTNFICDDLQHSVSNGQSWTANVGQSNPVGSTVRFSAADVTNPDLTGKGLTQQEMYNMVTWLAMQMFANPTSFSANAALDGAIWSVMDGGWGVSGYVSSGAQADVLASLAYKDTNNGNLVVYTPINPTSTQEFLSETPEPVSTILMGTFLLLASLLLGRKGLLA